MTHPVQRLLMETITWQKEDSYFSASNSDYYHLTTGQVLNDMRGWTNVGNIMLRGNKTSTYTVIAGLRHIIAALADFRFDRELIQWAKGLTNGAGPVFNPEYLDSLLGQPFSCKVAMMPDGSIAFPGPLGRIEGHPLQAKWIDTIISDFLRRGSHLATKAARLKRVADQAGIMLAENAMRRSNDTGGLLTAEIPVMIGLNGTSHMRAAIVNGQQAVGTMDHWYVMVKMAEYFDLNPEADDQDAQQQRYAQQHAFRCFLKEFPEYGALLLDTLSLEAGIEDAIIVFQEFKPHHYAVRIDSGDLAAGAKWVRQKLDDAGMKNITIALSGGLRAVNLYALWKQSTPFDSAGIGEYFQYGGERQRNPGEDPFESPVNTEIVTKAGYILSPSGRRFGLIKMSESRGKTSRAGIADRLRLLGEDASTRAPILLGDVEVDLLSKEGGFAGETLPFDLASLRLDTEIKRVFPKGTRVARPIVPLLDGPDFIGADLLEPTASHQRHLNDMALVAGQNSLMQIDGSHSGCPVGIEFGHHMRNYVIARNQQVVQRLPS